MTDMEFLAEQNMDVFIPHADHGVVPEDVLCSFVEEHADIFLATTKLESKLKSADRIRDAEEVVTRANVLFNGTYGFDNDKKTTPRK